MQVTPIFQSATFLYRGESTYDAVRYTRCNNNPSQLVVGAKLAALEGAEAAAVTSSGMAAISTTLMALMMVGVGWAAWAVGSTASLIFNVSVLMCFNGVLMA